jgi:hypothetical protein
LITRFLPGKKERPKLATESRIGETGLMADLLSWWSTEQANYPILARLVHVYLAVQATSALTEHIFSKASLQITKLRNRLDPEYAGQALHVAEHWHASRETDFFKMVCGDSYIDVDEDEEMAF